MRIGDLGQRGPAHFGQVYQTVAEIRRQPGYCAVEHVPGCGIGDGVDLRQRCQCRPAPTPHGRYLHPARRHAGKLAPEIVDKLRSPGEVAAFEALIRTVWSYEGSIETQAALKLLALLYSRPGELRLAKWPEFDLDGATWVIPAARAKMRRDHVKPLPAAAVQILRDLRAHTGNYPFVFPSQLSPGKPISENTLNGALRRIGIQKTEHTAHGFRASASSLLNESGLWNRDAIEAELAHVGADQVRRAYHRTTT